MLQYSAENDHEEFKFLEYQLEAFYKLCHVSNTYYLSIWSFACFYINKHPAWINALSLGGICFKLTWILN